MAAIFPVKMSPITRVRPQGPQVQLKALREQQIANHERDRTTGFLSERTKMAYVYQLHVQRKYYAALHEGK